MHPDLRIHEPSYDLYPQVMPFGYVHDVRGRGKYRGRPGGSYDGKAEGSPRQPQIYHAGVYEDGVPALPESDAHHGIHICALHDSVDFEVAWEYRTHQRAAVRRPCARVSVCMKRALECLNPVGGVGLQIFAYQAVAGHRIVVEYPAGPAHCHSPLLSIGRGEYPGNILNLSASVSCSSSLFRIGSLQYNLRTLSHGHLGAHLSDVPIIWKLALQDYHVVTLLVDNNERAS